MAEIDSLYGKGGSGADKKNMKKPSGSGASRREEERKQTREEQKQEEINFDSGFDHGFENMATFNGRSIGKDAGPAQSVSLSSNAQPAQQQAASNANSNQQKTNFDFNFDDQPAQNTTNQPSAQVDLDALLSGEPKKTGSFAAKQVDIFDFDNVQPAQNTQQPNLQNFNAGQINIPQQQQPNPAGAAQPQTGFVPNPMSHIQQQQQQQQAMMQNQMMANMIQHFQYQTNMAMAQ